LQGEIFEQANSMYELLQMTYFAFLSENLNPTFVLMIYFTSLAVACVFTSDKRRW
jgi:hypothetical protein